MLWGGGRHDAGEALLPADHVRPGRPRFRTVPQRGVRPRAQLAHRCRRGRGDHGRQRPGVRPSPRRCSVATRPARPTSPIGWSPARCGSTATTCANSPHRSAVPATPAWAARAERGASTSSATSRTSQPVTTHSPPQHTQEHEHGNDQRRSTGRQPGIMIPEPGRDRDERRLRHHAGRRLRRHPGPARRRRRRHAGHHRHALVHDGVPCGGRRRPLLRRLYVGRTADDDHRPAL